MSEGTTRKTKDPAHLFPFGIDHRELDALL
jgi:hypothetical protein